MIRSAVLRLTLAYLAILMALSLTFSYLLFGISSREFSRELREPSVYQVRPGVFVDLRQFKESRVSEAQHRLLNNLILFNLGTLIVGSILSYSLAKRNIHPIEEALEAQSRFTADASHELRTPLTALQTEIEVSLRDKKLTLKTAKDQLRSNLEEVIKLRTLSDRLLKLARNDRAIDLKKTSYKTVVAKAIDQIEPLAVSKNIMLDNQAGDIKVVANAQQLQDTLIILLDNAIKYSPTKSTITITATQKSNTGTVSVADQGQGIRQADLPHIFERFYRADHSRSKDGQPNGHGLGLSIAHQMITSQKGSIGVQSTVKKGSTFSINLPLYKSK